MSRKPRRGYMPPTLRTKAVKLAPDLADRIDKQALGLIQEEYRDGMVLWLATEDLTRLRKKIRTAARTLELDAAVREVRAHLLEWVVEEQILTSLQALPKAEQAKLLLQAKRAGAALPDGGD